MSENILCFIVYTHIYCYIFFVFCAPKTQNITVIDLFFVMFFIVLPLRNIQILSVFCIKSSENRHLCIDIFKYFYNF